jgi:hypothetical protein
MTVSWDENEVKVGEAGPRSEEPTSGSITSFSGPFMSLHSVLILTRIRCIILCCCHSLIKFGMSTPLSVLKLKLEFGKDQRNFKRWVSR